MPESSDETNLYNLRVDYDFDFATLTSITSYTDREVHALKENAAIVPFLFDGFIGFNINLPSYLAGDPPVIPCNPGPQDELFSNPFACPYGDGMTLRAFNLDSNTESERFVQELRLVSSGDGKLLWTAGLFYKESDDLRNDVQPVDIFPGREQFAPFFEPFFTDPGNTHEDTIEEISVFGEVTYAFTPQWELTLGARYASIEQSFENTATDTDDTPFSPKVVLAWRPVDTWLAYALYAEGFRPGNVNNAMEFNVRSFTAGGFPQEEIDKVAGLVVFDGDEVKNYEVGAKATLFDGRVDATASVYYLEWDDMITEVTDPTIPSAANFYNRNVGSATSQGVELELTAVPIDNLRIRLAGDINDTELDDDIAAPKGNSLIYAPEYSYSIGVDYTWNFPGSLSGNFRIDYQEVDDQWADIENTIEIPGYDITNLRFTLTPDSGNWYAAIFANNVTNEEIVTNRVDFVGQPIFIWNRPRVIGLEVSYRGFGR